MRPNLRLGLGILAVGLGFASSAAAAPWETEIVYSGTAWGVLNGDAAGKRAWHGNVDLMATLDTEQLLGLAGTTVFLYLLNDHGGKLNKDLGTGQGVDNIEVASNATRLYEAWLEIRGCGGRCSARMGLYDLNSEFYVTDSSAMFLHPAMGIGTDFAQTGANGPSIFPVTSLGLRLLAQPHPQAYLMGAVLDAVPGDPEKPRGTHVILDEEEGVLGVVEAGWRFGHTPQGDPSGKLAVGLWAYSEPFPDLVEVGADGDPLARDDRGVYLMVEGPLFPGGGPRAFLRYGTANADIDRFEHAVGAGLHWQGPLPGRPEDEFGVAVAAAQTGDKFEQAAKAAGEPVAAAEVAWEVSYRAKLADWLTVQPDLQYIQYTGGTAPGDSLVAGLRIEVSLKRGGSTP